jgi:hypothetical protein
MALLVLLPSVAAAAPLVHEHYSDSFSFDFDDCGFVVHDEVTVQGLLMLKAPRADGAPPYFFDNNTTHETLTANGKTITIDHRSLYKTLHVTHVSGTIYQFTEMQSGQPFVVRDADGERVFFDRGRLLFTFQVDTKGDTDLDNDEFIDGSFRLLRDSGSHPGFYADFCQDIIIPLLGS